ncbi:MAG: HEAT repeat domain-containing protein [Hormoscilla sp. GM102CHS1]|nr:HEAT repeat domain-containing protein [Hormoscilla sp. GM102CHS1]
MNIYQIEAALSSSDSNARLKAIAQLRGYNPKQAVPLLRSKLQDPEFLVRSFVAMGLGRQQTPESFTALLELMKCDRDPNVRAEAANSLSMFGKIAASHLVLAFHQDDHWLVRRSIMAALCEMPCPEELLDVCVCGLAGEDLTVREAAIDGFGVLASGNKQAEALQQVLPLVSSTVPEKSEWRIRARVARALRKFDHPQAKSAISYMMKDEDHRVVAAALESSL